MSEARSNRRVFRRAAFLGISLILLLVQLLPLGDGMSVWPGPDLMLCLVVAWVLRRPADLPSWFLAPVLLLCDLLLMRPPGLWALLVLCASEFLQRRQARTRSLPFLGELALVSVVSFVLVTANSILLSVFYVDQTGLLEQLKLVPVTLLAYPFVVFALQTILGIRKRPAPEGFGRTVSP